MSFSSIMVHLTVGTGNEKVLQIAADFAERLKVQRIIGIAGCQPLQVYGDGVGYISSGLFELDRAEIEKEMKEAEEQFRTILNRKAAKLEWRSTVTFGLIADFIAREARAADLLITTPKQIGSIFDSTRRVGVADLVMHVGRPVIVVGEAVQQLDLGNIVVGWKESREARRAVKDALPLLRIAGSVTITEITSKEGMPGARERVDDVVNWLRVHDIEASSSTRIVLEDEATELDGLAEELGAGMVVGGAYGHSRLREWVLGGVTRDLLLRPRCCSFVSH